MIPALIRKMHSLAGGDRALGRRDARRREFLYVEDARTRSSSPRERYDGPEPVNIGTGREISIRDLVELVADLTGFTGQIRWDESMPNGQPRRSLDASRAKELFGFEARNAAARGPRRTIAWYRSASGLRP